MWTKKEQVLSRFPVKMSKDSYINIYLHHIYLRSKMKVLFYEKLIQSKYQN